MKKLFIAGNWKSFKTLAEAKDWVAQFTNFISGISATPDKAMVLSVPFTLLSFVSGEIFRLKLPLQLGAENVSPLPEGAYTGEINAKQIKEFAEWVIIGHSERRKNFGETDATLVEKVKLAKAANLKVIFCVQDERTPVPDGIEVIAYEPPWAISAVSNWKTESPEAAGATCQIIKTAHPSALILYGGSTSPENIISFISQPAIEGVLSGGASLDSKKFAMMIRSAFVANL